ncbi:hypothetical protein L1887_05928 [Cichorium endivia]|nr:hypothetical protein L1887_05928 [Cichorium endivia]
MKRVTKRVGKYEFGRTIGEGTFAKVKFAKNTETGGAVAIKILAKSTILKHKMVDQPYTFNFIFSILVEHLSSNFNTVSDLGFVFLLGIPPSTISQYRLIRCMFGTASLITTTITSPI